MPLYYNILDKMSLFTQNWDYQSHVPYLTGNNSLQTFVSYDNEQSIAKKAQYIIDHELAGAIIWEITGDYIETSPGSGIIADTPLSDTLVSILVTTNVKNKFDDESPFVVSPNPTTGKVNIISSNIYNYITVKIINIMGKIVLSKEFNNQNDISLNINEPDGIYFVYISTSNDNCFIHKVIKSNYFSN
jgi:GH18 family chitinase